MSSRDCYIGTDIVRHDGLYYLTVHDSYTHEYSLGYLTEVEYTERVDALLSRQLFDEEMLANEGLYLSGVISKSEYDSRVFGAKAKYGLG